MLSKQIFDELLAGVAQPGWRELVADAHRRIRQDLGGRALPSAEEMLRQVREERTEYLDTMP